VSMKHTRASLQRTIPKVGDALYSNERKKMLTIIEDKTSGVHDTLIAACDRWRYHELGVEGALKGSHRNCADNLGEGLETLGKTTHCFLCLESGEVVVVIVRIENRKTPEADSDAGIEKPQFTPQPLNLFMNIPVHEDRTSLSFEQPTGKPREYIDLKAEMDLIVVMSACPQVSCSLSDGYNGGSIDGEILGYSENKWRRT
jgi:uncharacterized protein YcgI (DUF1989 family)